MGLNVLYHHRSLADGAEGVHIAQIVAALRSLGHRVDVCSPVGSATNTQTPRATTLARVKAALPRSAFELAEIGYGGPGALWLLSRMPRLRPNVVYERYACANAAGVLAKAGYGIPLILEINAPLVLERQQHEGGLALARLLGAAERFVFRRADRCLVVSTPLAEYVASRGVPEERIEVMPNGAAAGDFDPADSGARIRRRHDLDGKLVVGFCGVLRPWHGVEMLVEAVAGFLPGEARVLLIGDGPSAGAVMALARGLGLENRVHVTGRIPHAEMPAHLAACDITVSPRATFYASPMKIVEYMAAGRAVVAPRMPNIADLVDDGRTGLLFEPESAASLGGTLARLAADADFRRSLARAARREVESRLDWRNNAQRIVEIAEELSAR